MHDVTFTHETGRRLAVVSYTARPEEIGAKAGEAFATVAARLAGRGVALGGPAVSCYSRGPQVFDVASGFVVAEDVEPGDGVEALRLPECEVATTTHVGPYDELGTAYEDLRQGVAARGRRLAEEGLMWEEYWSDPQTPPEQTRTVVCWPLAADDA
jgi:effector-binding domain-containing protein